MPTTMRHHPVVRITHWVNAIALTVMIGSGLRIFNAYPRFARRGEEFCCYPFPEVEYGFGIVVLGSAPCFRRIHLERAKD